MARVVSNAVAPRGAVAAVAQSSLVACAEAALAMHRAATKVVLVFLNMKRGESREAESKRRSWAEQRQKRVREATGEQAPSA
jgi:hypothetical protein